ncbi:hypothetical protein L7F22_069330 [Adiantum nelumboides]|nr:hypothetical protein [Adiantum nelumboides]
MSNDGAWQKKVDTTKLSQEEMKNLHLENAKRPPGQSPGNTLHMQGGVGVKRAGAYPFFLAGCLVLVGVGTWAYYTSSKPDEHKTKDTAHIR